ncbi:hypothetical protein [Amycolatopsis australiensis]|uniref:Uncharacterized protein n=1 Tax=Amycolatopsis australiensis TaxID=546364 RepID=A0A1K1S592_9PSEU|nr:hypothetical protein [Amycolatopsis australiensis]SFW79370.1 hypothetical protein SAMN04489730_4724 [Amycolatopsis australiensis]
MRPGTVRRPGHAELVEEVIPRLDTTAAGLERTVLPGAADEFALRAG